MIEPLHKVTTMFWKFLNLQKLLDALFDDSWFHLGLPDGGTDAELALSERL
jgi:hypothetical protein